MKCRKLSNRLDTFQVFNRLSIKISYLNNNAIILYKLFKKFKTEFENKEMERKKHSYLLTSVESGLCAGSREKAERR